MPAAPPLPTKAETGPDKTKNSQALSFKQTHGTGGLSGLHSDDDDDDDVAKYLREKDQNDADSDDDHSPTGVSSLFFSDTPTEESQQAKKRSAPDAETEGEYMTDAQAAQKTKSAQMKQPQDKKQQRQQQPPTGRNFTVRESKKIEESAPVTFNFSSGTSGSKTISNTTPSTTKSDSLLFYWLDAREDGTGLLGTGGHSSPGTVYLFGKVIVGGQAESCCLRVGGLKRQVFMLPREGIAMIDAQREVSRLCSERGIPKRRVDVRERWYGFEDDGIPRDVSQWIKLSYDPSYRELGITPNHSTDVQKYLNSVTHAFGDNRSFLEMFLLKKRLKGPSWIQIPKSSLTKLSPNEQLSRCRTEYSVTSYKDIKTNLLQAPPPPKLKAMSVSLHTFLNESTSTNEIIAISCITYIDVDVEKSAGPKDRSYRWAGIRPGGDLARLPPPHMIESFFKSKNVPSPEQLHSEAQLLESFISVVSREDPDMFVGHNFVSYDLDVLLHRLSHFKINNWDTLGRLRLRYMPKLQSGVGGSGDSTWEERSVLAGRLVTDTYLLSKEYYGKADNYKLRQLAYELNLGVTLDTLQVPDYISDGSDIGNVELLYHIVSRTDEKAGLTFRLADALQAIQLTKRLTYLAGNLWSRTLTGSRAERTEYLLMHDFYAQKYVLPDRRSVRTKTAKRKAKYCGGMVLDPKKGLYTDYVLLLDFNSLYPSLIQEYQICFSTVARTANDDDESVPPIPPPEALVCSKCRDTCTVCPHKCILPKAIKNLVDDRRAVKKAIASEKNPEMRGQYDVLQKALKLTANSIYGCLGFEHSRFYAQKLAMMVTYKGREALANTIDLVHRLPEHNLNVVYGDTDSVMINTGISNTEPMQQAIDKANIVKRAVNSKYSSLEIDIDGVYKNILLVRKKKYAAVTVTADNKTHREVKGLDLVRRDWCTYTSDAQRVVLDFILNGDEEETVRENILNYLEQLAAEVRSPEARLERFLITKSLTKDPTAYVDGTSQPHVVIALRLREKKIPVNSGGGPLRC
eukprot:TRINITY_DN7592_c0_g1_i1.p1 TRINITY_DN7592_c0_g1~~TRINITY_DN7592_c0_g1_i1.p1  ORF type:complete len:1103 (+),score=217.84 TRINITY_DN7592_c0_g1_i1:238-3309(+)